jgi:hypothetical protein
LLAKHADIGRVEKGGEEKILEIIDDDDDDDDYDDEKDENCLRFTLKKNPQPSRITHKRSHSKHCYANSDLGIF